MSAGKPDKSAGGNVVRLPKPSARRCRVLVTLTEEQLAAAEAWRSVNGFADQSEAMGELVRLGLLSEIAKVYHLVTAPRAGDERTSNGPSATKEHWTDAWAFPDQSDL